MCNVPLIGVMRIVILDRSERKWTHLLLGKSRKIQNQIVRAVHLVETALWNLPAKSKQAHPAHILKGRKAQCTDHRVGALMRSRSGCRIRCICCGLCVPLLCLGRFPWCSVRIQLADHMTDRIHQIPQWHLFVCAKSDRHTMILQKLRLHHRRDALHLNMFLFLDEF